MGRLVHVLQLAAALVAIAYAQGPVTEAPGDTNTTVADDVTMADDAADTTDTTKAKVDYLVVDQGDYSLWFQASSAVEWEMADQFTRMGVDVLSADNQKCSNFGCLVSNAKKQWDFCGHRAEDYFPLFLRATVVAVKPGAEFSGWETYEGLPEAVMSEQEGDELVLYDHEANITDAGMYYDFAKEGYPSAWPKDMSDFANATIHSRYYIVNQPTAADVAFRFCIEQNSMQGEATRRACSANSEALKFADAGEPAALEGDCTQFQQQPGQANPDPVHAGGPDGDPKHNWGGEQDWGAGQDGNNWEQGNSDWEQKWGQEWRLRRRM
ncbi:unnamed protein product [Vitrella brassicaformis CCMP3155]|uniref:Uncharacterized protein n=2 Tax=Vitrella brassicaformis TaxID=1169539 RepID=A0A0G4FIR6_VITBC|nr:unnamed protein product [Vitrella brassicaformis CCMP3155]|eukprot:CEM13186.1 unnamed protein product [Vitrella brassicaformis CCMP3155]